MRFPTVFRQPLKLPPPRWPKQRGAPAWDCYHYYYYYYYYIFIILIIGHENQSRSTHEELPAGRQRWRRHCGAPATPRLGDVKDTAQHVLLRGPNSKKTTTDPIEHAWAITSYVHGLLHTKTRENTHPWAWLHPWACSGDAFSHYTL